MLTDDSFDNLLELLSALADEQITDAQLAQLVERLRHEPEAREIYREHATMQALLRREAGREMAALPMVDVATLMAESTTSDSDTETLDARPMPAPNLGRFARIRHATGRLVTQRGPFSMVIAGLFVGAMLTLFAVVGAPLFRQQPELALWEAAPSQGIARLNRTLDVCWANPEQAPAVGQILQTGQRVAVLEGLLEVEFFSGTKIIVEGPATVEFRAKNEGYLGLGRLVATVPGRATGFKIQTPHATIVDLGTEFGVQTQEELGTRVNVLKGMVEVQPSGVSPSGAGRVLHPGMALAISADGMTVSDDLFNGRPFHRMIAALERPKLPVHYSFDTNFKDDAGNANHGVAVDGNGDKKIDGVSITTTAGEWKFGGGAANFTEARDYINIPTLPFSNGEPYSVAFWARKAAGDTAQAAEWDMVIGRPGNSSDFIALNGQDAENAYLRWRNINRSSEADFYTDSAGDVEVWHHYVVIAGDFEDDDTLVDEIRLYVDGKLVGTQDDRQTEFVFDAIGEGYISTSNYDMHGQIDEVWIFDRSLNDEEVKSLFEKNVLVPKPQ